jgi:hypothetical protein
MDNKNLTDEWYEIVSLRESGGELLPGTDPEVWVRGTVGEITVVQVDLEGVTSAQQGNILQGLSRLLEDAGIQKAIIIPQSIRFMRLRRATEEQMHALTEMVGNDSVITRMH